MRKSLKLTTNGVMAFSLLFPLSQTALADKDNNSSKESKEITSKNPWENFVNKPGEGQPIPEKNDIIIQKLEYKYSKLDRSNEMLDPKNNIGHNPVDDSIEPNRSKTGESQEKNAEKYKENDSHKRYRDKNKIPEDKVSKPNTSANFYEENTAADTRDQRLGCLDDIKQPGIQNTGEPISPDVLRNEYQVKAYSPSLYGEVEFSLFKLDRSKETLNALVPEGINYKTNPTKEEQKAFSQASMKTAKKVGEEIEKAFKEGKKLPYGAKLVSTQKVGDDGATTFKDVKTYDEENGDKKSNLYMIVETKHPKLVVGKSNPMLLNLPIVDPNGEYKDRIHLYPKNEVKEATIPFQKYKDDIDGDLKKNDGPLEGAKFKVYKGDPKNHAKNKALQKGGKDIILTTNKKGQLDITGNVRGVYYLVEQEVANLVDGMIVKSEKYKARDGFKYLAGFDSLNNEFNVLVYNIGADGVARYGAEIGKGKELSKANVLEFTNHAVPKFEKIIKSDRKLEQGWNYFEDIPFEVSQTIPDNIYQYSKFEFKDQLERLDDDNKTSEGVKPTDHAEFIKGKDGKIAFDVVNDRNEKLEKGVDYFVVKESDNQFEISLANPAKNKLTAKDTTPENNRFTEKVRHSKKITVKYKAQLKANADPDVLYNNKAEFTYNNAPQQGLTPDRYNHDGKKFQTFGYKFQKFDKGLLGTKLNKQTLEGAEFIVKDKDGKFFNGYIHNENATGGQEPFFTEFKSNKAAYESLRKDPKHKDAVIISGKDGKFEIKGLKEGEYTLVEMKAPNGFRQDNLPETKFTVKKITYTETDKKPLAIQNERAPEVPFTGSEKLMITTIAGFMIIAVGTTAYVMKRKTEEGR